MTHLFCPHFGGKSSTEHHSASGFPPRSDEKICANLADLILSVIPLFYPAKEDVLVKRDVEHLRFLGIDHLCERPYTHISGVERQLVLLAATLTQCPALYLRAQTLVLKDKIRWKHGAVEDVIDEASMTELYELPVHIGNIGTRTVCVGGDIA